MRLSPLHSPSSLGGIPAESHPVGLYECSYGSCCKAGTSEKKNVVMRKQ